MFKIVILVCSLTVDPRHCNVATAISVTHGPDAANELMCGRDGQAYLAQTELVPQPGEYVKIQCVRSHNAQNLG